jgi:hypothetical protein
MTTPNLNDPIERTAYWTKVAADLLVGRTIVKVRYLIDEELDNIGFSSRAVVLQLDNGILVYPARDDEGNDAGALFTTDPKTTTLPVL